jgi:glycosyltransferase involved in cell wall biosynthesis
MRSALDIDETARIVLFVSQTNTNTRKGFSHLKKALVGLNAGLNSEIHLASIGRNAPEVKSNVPHTHLGSISSDVLLSAIFSMADLFVIPSRQDNLPNTVLEAMACGTPVVGYDTGGIPDMVRPGKTGWLAESQNVRSLRDAIDRALADEANRERRGRQCRQVVQDEYTLRRQAQQYVRLYESILSDSEEGQSRPSE